MTLTRYMDRFSSHHAIYLVLTTMLVVSTCLTIAFGVLWGQSRSKPASQVSAPIYATANGIVGFPPRLPNYDPYVQWTFLHMNDVYELLPLNNGRKGGLARVAYMRQLLREENPNTITVLGGDLVSPSALGTSKVNGTTLNGKQMVATMNTLGLDYMTFGNHEFDLDEKDLLTRMNESNFKWIGSNVFRNNSNELFGPSLSHDLITIGTVRILIIGFTIEGTGNYIKYINQSYLVNHTKDFLTRFPNGTYDVLVALTHLDLATDIALVTNIPQIDLIMGGHEHEDNYVLRGTDYTPIYKADANAVTVYIHRCAFNLRTRQFRIYSTLARVTPEVPEENRTATVAQYWYDLGIEGFRLQGYEPSEVISCLPGNIELDGRSESVRTSQTLLSDLIGESMISATASNATTVSVFNSGAIRIDDILSQTITQYDILRTLPFVNYILVLSVPGPLLARVLTIGMSRKESGSFISYTGVRTSDDGRTWFDLQGRNLTANAVNYTVATIEYARTALGLDDASVLAKLNVTQTRGLIDYLKVKYPPC